MNISSYTECEEKIKIYSCKFTLMKGMHIVNADEKVYRYLGNNAGKSMSALIHRDDYVSFEDAVSHLGEGTQYIIARFMNYYGAYRYMYMILNYNGRVVDDFKEIDVEIHDIMAINERYNKICLSLDKYRGFMTFSSHMYMEYYYESEIINFYDYTNGHSVTFFKETMETANKMILENEAFSEKQKEEFRTLCDLLKNKADNIEVSVDGLLFGIPNYYLTIKGGILYDGEKKNMFAAVVSKTNYGEVVKEKYYNSVYALDSATDAYNKRAITELAHDVLHESNKKHFLCMMDVDDFKLINDTYGHLIGDKIMAQVAATIHRIVGTRGYLGRFGGDEFLILADKVEDMDEMIMMLKAIRKNISYSCKDIAPGLNVTFSIGIAEYPTHGKSYEELLRVADKCLYIAKAKGKNRYIKYDPSLHGRIDEDDSSADNDAKINLSRRYLDVYNFMYDIRNYGADGIAEVLDNIRNTFDIDGVSVFDNVTHERKYMSGRYVNPYEKLDFLDSLTDMHDGSGVIAFNKITYLEENYPDIYNTMNRQNTSGVAFVKGNNNTVVFDVFGRNRKWSDNDKGMLMMIARTIDEIVGCKQ